MDHPSFVDRGVRFFSNINDIGVTLNDLLQFKVAQTQGWVALMVNTVPVLVFN